MIKKYLFDVNKNEKLRILNLHSNINESSLAKYTNSVIVGGKEIPVSKNTENIYKASFDSSLQGQVNFRNALFNNIKDIVDLNMVEKDLASFGSSIEKLLKKIFVKFNNYNDAKSYKTLKEIESKFRNIVNMTVGEALAYNTTIWNGQLTFQSKLPNYAVRKGTTQQPTTPKSAPQTQPKQKITRIKEGWPLIKGMQGDSVQKLQQKLGVKQTGFFWDLTQAALTKKMKEIGKKYDPTKGLTQSDYNDIMGITTPDYPGGFRPNP